MNNYAIIKAATNSLALIFLLSACSSPTPQKKHDHDPHTNVIKQYNANILNCVGPSGHHVYEADYTCPLGGKKFTALELGTHSTMGVHLDWQPISYMRFPVAIPVCPNNGFIADKADINEKELAARKTFIESQEYQALYKEKHASFFLLAKQSESLQENLDSLWWYYLQATWEADGCNNQDRYAEYAALVIEKATEQKAKLTEKDEAYWPMSIIITDMYRRTGQFELAQQQLNTIGIPEFDNPKSNAFYSFAKKTMQTAIDQKSTASVPVRVPQGEK